MLLVVPVPRSSPVQSLGLALVAQQLRLVAHRADCYRGLPPPLASVHKPRTSCASPDRTGCTARP
eukprot:686086-Heterocapsa_arctica.AAC.1